MRQVAKLLSAWHIIITVAHRRIRYNAEQYKLKPNNLLNIEFHKKWSVEVAARDLSATTTTTTIIVFCQVAFLA